MGTPHVLQQIYEVLVDRKKRLPPDSYTASLFRQGEDAVLKKVGEEACEVILASKSGKEDEIIHETGDLFFHLLALLGWHGIPPERIFDELEKRFGVSGFGEPGKRGS